MAGHTLRGYLGTVDYKDGGALKSYFFGVFAHHSGAAFFIFSFLSGSEKAQNQHRFSTGNNKFNCYEKKSLSNIWRNKKFSYLCIVKIESQARHQH